MERKQSDEGWAPMYATQTKHHYLRRAPEDKHGLGMLTALCGKWAAFPYMEEHLLPLQPDTGGPINTKDCVGCSRKLGKERA